MSNNLGAKCLLSMSGALIVGTLLYFVLFHDWNDKDKVLSENSGEIDRQDSFDARSTPPLTSAPHAVVPNPERKIPDKQSSLFPRKPGSVEKQKIPIENLEVITVLPESVLRETRDRASDVARTTIETEGKNLTLEQRRKIEGLIAERDKMSDELRKASLSETEKVAKTKEVNDRINGKIQSVLRGEE